MWFWSTVSRTHLQSLGVCLDGESAKECRRAQQKPEVLPSVIES